MTIQDRIEIYCNWATAIAADNTHGYSQINRWSPDFDCSSFVISALEQAGYKMRESGASYTGNMITPLLKCGFRFVNDKTLKRGDILLSHTDVKQHTAIYLGNSKIVHARGAHGHTETGDQDGTEICISDYYPFEMVFRLQTEDNESEVVKVLVKEVRNGSRGHHVKVVQTLLNQFINANLECDLIAGNLTCQAIKAYQFKMNLVVDGIVGENTWNSLLNSEV